MLIYHTHTGNHEVRSGSVCSVKLIIRSVIHNTWLIVITTFIPLNLAFSISTQIVGGSEIGMLNTWGSRRRPAC